MDLDELKTIYQNKAMKVLSIFQKNETLIESHTAKEAGVASPGKPTAENAKEESISAESDTATPEVDKRVHNLIILDESGSMQSIYQPALTGVNETLQTIREAEKEHEGQKHFVSLIAFDSGHYNQIYLNTPADKAIDITKDQYRPGGCTPLYDAMGRAINNLRPDVAKGDIVLVTVITDGYENDSLEYSGKAIKSLVEAMKKEGWIFTYIGANQDVEAVAASMSINNRLSFEANDESTAEMFQRECSSRRRFFGRIVSTPKQNLSTGYYDDDCEENGNKDML